MSTPSTAELLKYSGLQMAAEAFLRNETTGALAETGQSLIDALVDGNKHSSKFTVTQAIDFEKNWMVVDQRANTSTGFSGTLFKYTGQTDAARGLVSGELVMSLRSTEFIDDAGRDNKATNELELKAFGWAFGQIDDMEKWYAELNADPEKLQGKSFAVTGYSLGGHLATAFNLLRSEQGQASRITQTYTFNGAGVGEVVGSSAVGLSYVISQFDEMRTQGNMGAFSTQRARNAYGQVLQNLVGTVHTAAVVQGQLDYLSWIDGAGPLVPLNEDLWLLRDALIRMRDIAAEAERVSALKASNGTAIGGFPSNLQNMAGVDLDYQLAVLRTAKGNTRAFNSGVIAGGIQSFPDNRDVLPGLSNFFDVYGSTYRANDFSAVTNSQHHYGEAVAAWIESQPLLRGNYLSSLGASVVSGETKLIFPEFDKNDFGDTHSLVLIVDSLTVQNTLVQLDSTLDFSKLRQILDAASASKASWSVNTQGTADGDTLEKTVNALARLLGVSGATLKGNLSGGSWAETDNKDGYTGRTAFQKLVSDIDGKIKADGLAGKFTISTSHDVTTAKADFAALMSLLSGATFSLRAKDEAAKTLIAAKLGAAYPDELALFNADQTARAQGQTLALNYTDNYLSDRSALLNWQIYGDVKNLQPNSEFVTKIQASSGYGVKTHFIDLVAGQQINVGDQTAITSSTKYIIFGDEQGNILNGGSAVDHIYGGSGGDTIDGQAGNDYLEGNAGNDQLRGGAGIDTLFGGAGDDTLDGGKDNDTLAGGRGNDTYILRASDNGTDTIIDLGGEGSIKVIAADSSETTLGSSAIKKLSNSKNTWQSEDKRFIYTTRVESDGSTTLSISGGGISAVVKNFTSGDLGINLPGSISAPSNPTTGQQIFGDFAPMDFDPASEGVQIQLDALSNIITDPSQPQPDRADTLYDSAGDDEIVAGGGADHIIATRGGTNWVKAGSGRDSVEGGAGSDLIELGSERDYGVGGGGADRLYADAQRTVDELLAQNVAAADDQADILDGGNGDDTVMGDAGNDALFGGEGKDLLVGGAGDDVMFGDLETAAVQSSWSVSQQPVANSASPGRALALTGISTQLPSQEGADLMFGGAGNDYMVANGGDDYLDGGANDDVMLGGTGADSLIGGEGDDHMHGDGSTQNATVLGYAAGSDHGNDYLDGGAGNDWMMGGGKDDVLYGGTGDDLMHGDNTQDLLAGEFHGNDYLDGGDGNDRMAGDGKDDVLYGGAGNDVLNGDNTQDLLAGEFHGNDYLDGGDGDDVLAGSGKDDVLYGGAGDDILHGDDSQNNLAASFHGNDLLDGGEGNDILIGGGKDDWLTGGAGNDQLFGDDITIETSAYVIDAAAHGNDSLDGGAGDDLLVGGGGNDQLLGGEGDDLLKGDGEGLALAFQGNDTLDGGAGNDALYGNGGNDSLTGGAGDDLLDGGAGDDVLDGGAGNNLLKGGAGNDRYLLASADATTTTDAVTGQVMVDTVIDDTEGRNTLQIDASLADLRVEAGEDGLGLRWGDAGVYLKGAASAAAYEIELADGTRTTMRKLAGATLDSVVQQVSGEDAATVAGGKRADTLAAYGKGSVISGGLGDDDVQLGGENQTFEYAQGDGADRLGGGGRGAVIALQGSYQLADFRLESRLLQLSNGAGETWEEQRLSLRMGPGENDRLDLDIYTGALGSSVLIDRFTLAGTEGAPAQVLHFSELLARGVTMMGTAQDDFLQGSDIADTIDAMAGDDTVSAGAGNDTILAGVGNKQLAGGAGMDRYVINGGGANAIRIEDYEGASVVRLAGVSDWQDVTLLQPVAGSSDLVLSLADGGQVTLANALLQADSFSIELAGGETRGLATLVAGLDALAVTGGYNADVIAGSGQDDLLDGGAGNDQLAGGAGNDWLLGGSGQDRLAGGLGDDMLFGGEGDDSYAIEAGGGNDEIFDYEGSNTVRFAAGLDPSQLLVERLEDSTDVRISVDGGNSVLVRRALEGAVSSYEFADGSRWSYADLINRFTSPDGQGKAGDDLNNTVEGSSGGDLLLGNGGNDVLRGHAGNDELQGGDDNDELYGGAGNDLLNGGAGTDRYHFALGDGEDRLIDVTDASILKFGAGIRLQSLSATRTTVNGDDYIRLAYSATDAVLIKDGVLLPGSAFQFSDGTSATQTEVYAQALMEARIAPAYTEGDDVIDGYAGNDVLLGGGGADRLLGGNGDDSLDGGADDDALEGGAGTDTYVMSLNGGRDTLVERFGEDSILSLSQGDESSLSYARTGSHLLVSSASLNSSFYIRDFYTGTGSWTLKTAQGAELDLRALVAAGLLNKTAEQRREDFYAGLTAQPGSVELPSGAVFYVTGAKEFSDAAGNQFAYSFNRERRLTQSDGAHIEATANEINQTVDYTDLGAVSRTRTYDVVDVSYTTTGVTIPGRTVRVVNSSSQIFDPNHPAYGGVFVPPGYSSYVGPDGKTYLVEPSKTVITRTPTYSTRTVTETYDEYLHRTVVAKVSVIEDVRGGDQDNTITLSGTASKLVSGGGGDDVIIRGGPATDVLDYSQPSYSDWADGGAGNDTIVLGRGDDELSGGMGNDYLAGGAGADCYVVSADDDGWDTIYDKAASVIHVELRSSYYGKLDTHLVDELLAIATHVTRSSGTDPFSGEVFGIESVSGDVEATPDNLNALLAIDRARPLLDEVPGWWQAGGRSSLRSRGLDQLIADARGLAFQSYDYSGGGPEVLRPDIAFSAATQAAYLKSATDTVRFGAGISLANLQMSWDTVELEDGTRDALLFSWGGPGGAKVVMPDPGAPLGQGIEVFEFADGSRLSMQQMLALAPPRGTGPANSIANGAPIAAVQVQEDQALSFSIPAGAFVLTGNRTARYGARLAGSGGELPSWLVFDTQTGTFSGTPQNGDVGELAIEVEAWQTSVQVARQTFTLRVANTNDAPELVSAIDSLSALTGESLSWALPSGVFADQDAGERLSYRIEGQGGSALPSWLRFNFVTGRLEGTPGAQDTGTFNLQVVATDLAGASVSTGFELTVSPDLTIRGGSADDELTGTAGDDVLQGLGGNDVLSGGMGNDVYLFKRGDGQDIIDDYDETLGNIDTVRFDSGISDSDVRVTFDSYGHLFLSIDGTEDRIQLNNWLNDDASKVENVLFADGTVWGQEDLAAMAVFGPTEGSDYLEGSEYGDFLSGLGGADELYGQGANDIIVGGSGDDYLDGGAGDDLLEGGTGNDTLNDGAGNDVYLYSRGDGSDRIQDYDETVGNIDTLRFYDGTITTADIKVTRGVTDLYLYIEGTGDRIALNDWLGDEGSRIEQVEFADGTVWDATMLESLITMAQGTEDDDSLYGTEASEVLSALGGDDDLVGNGGDDTLDGGAGNDYLEGGTGNDVYLFSRGSGSDEILDYDETTGNIDTIRFDATVAPGDIKLTRDGYNLFLGIEGADDRITLSGWFADEAYQVERIEFADGTVWTKTDLEAFPVVFLGTGGDDMIAGTDNADVIDGGAGNDTLNGGAGNDVYLYKLGDGSDIIRDNDSMAGNIDTLRFDGTVPATEVQATRDGNNLYLTISGSDMITLEGWFINGSRRIEQVEFADGTIWSTSVLEDMAGMALYEGTGGDDVLMGSVFADKIDGGTGDDLLNGSTGNDVYLFKRGDGQDTINEYDATTGNVDTVRFDSSVAVGDVKLGREFSHLYLRIDGTSDAIMLKNWFVNDGFKIEQVEFADGTVWNKADFAAMADATVFDDADGNHYVEGTEGNNTLEGGSGNDQLRGLAGNDVYLYKLGDGTDTIIDHDASAGNIDTVRFDSSVTLADIQVTRDQANLYLNIAGTTDRIILSNWFESDADKVERVEFADGTVWGLSDLLDLSIVRGTAGDDTLTGTMGDDVLQGLGGNDLLAGGFGNDVYLYKRGDGSDTITDSDSTSGNVDTVRFDGSVTVSDIKVTRDQYNLYLDISGTSDRITLRDWFSSNNNSAYKIEQVEFANGTIWNTSALAAMAVFAGTAGNDSVIGSVLGDVLDGGAGNDTLNGNLGNDVYLYKRGDGSDTISEYDTTAGNIDTLRFDSSVTVADIKFNRDGWNLYLGIEGTTDVITLARWYLNDGYKIEQVEFADGTVWNKADFAAMAATVVFGGTSGDDTLYGAASNDILKGLGGNDSLYGADGFDILEGGVGNDHLVGDLGSNYLNGGDGSDTLSGNASAADLFIGGTGNDVVNLGNGKDLIAFNVGGGQDTVYASGASVGPDDTISLGGAGLDYANLSLQRSSNDLVLKISATDQLTFTNWYLGTANKTVLNLQVVAEAMAAFNAGSTDPLLNKKVQTFDFQGLVGAFDAARAATPGLSSWALSNGLTQFHLAGSDSEALGGDLAYHYGADGTLAGMGLGKAQEVLANAQFGTQAQAIHSTASLQEGLIRLG